MSDLSLEIQKIDHWKTRSTEKAFLDYARNTQATVERLKPSTFLCRTRNDFVFLALILADEMSSPAPQSVPIAQMMTLAKVTVRVFWRSRIGRLSSRDW